MESGLITSEMSEFSSILDDLSYLPEDDAFGMRNLTYQEIRSDSDVPEDLRELLDFNFLKMQCDKRQRQMKKYAHSLNSQNEVERSLAEEHLNRYELFMIDLCFYHPFIHNL